MRATYFEGGAMGLFLSLQEVLFPDHPSTVNEVKTPTKLNKKGDKGECNLLLLISTGVCAHSFHCNPCCFHRRQVQWDRRSCPWAVEQRWPWSGWSSLCSLMSLPLSSASMAIYGKWDLKLGVKRGAKHVSWKLYLCGKYTLTSRRFCPFYWQASE